MRGEMLKIVGGRVETAMAILAAVTEHAVVVAHVIAVTIDRRESLAALWTRLHLHTHNIGYLQC